MSIELKIPDVGESIREVEIGRWLKQEGDSVRQDEDLVELETDKASLELPAPAAGVLSKILKKKGESVAVGDVVGYLEEQGNGSDQKKGKQRQEEPPQEADEEPSDDEDGEETQPVQKTSKTAGARATATPAARRALREHHLKVEDIDAQGPRIDRDDVLRYVQQREEKEAADQRQTVDQPAETEAAGEEVVPMSQIRRRIAERLVEAQQQAALLTTFNEIDLTAVKQLRKEYGERFQDRYGVKIGYMSFFVKAVVDALKLVPALNARIRDQQIVFRQYQHIGIAIGSKKGLVVPVLRNAERLSFAEIEEAIDDFAKRAANNKLAPQDLEGGTFTITNGGIYGSLLSTPIVNPPESGVLGMHAIEDRPVARDGQVVIRPMMYVALTYDHRLIDGREAITFLRRVKEALEDPARMLLEV